MFLKAYFTWFVKKSGLCGKELKLGLFSKSLTLYLICQFWTRPIKQQKKKDMTSKIWTKGDTIIRFSRKNCGKIRNFSLPAIFSFLTEAVYLWSKGLTHSHTMTPFDAPGKQAF